MQSSCCSLLVGLGKKKVLLSFILLFSFLTGLAQNPDIEVKLEAKLTKTGYVGESCVYEVILYSTSPNIADVRPVRSIKFPTEIKSVRGVVRGSANRVDNKGKFKYSWVILREYLIPEESGKFNIQGTDFIVFIPHDRIVNRGFWGNTRIREYEELTTRCNDVSIKINKLPKVPADFSGCVGDFKVESWFPRGMIYQDREAYVVFKISGYGSLQNLKVPPLNKLFVSGCRLKEVEQNDEILQRDGKLFSEVTLICKFIPEETSFEINSLCFEFFNSDTGKYYNACSDVLNWDGKPSNQQKVNPSKDAIAI